jgi:hypothetical protein
MQRPIFLYDKGHLREINMQLQLHVYLLGRLFTILSSLMAYKGSLYVQVGKVTFTDFKVSYSG